MTVCFRLLLRLFFGHALKLLGIGDWSGNHIPAAGPLAQVDQAAAVTAERKLFIRPQHQFAADGTPKRPYFILRHTRLDVTSLANDPRHQVVVVCFCNLTAIESTGHEFLMLAKIVNKQFAVNFWSMHLRAALP
jgi:hypothetical protein